MTLDRELLRKRCEEITDACDRLDRIAKIPKDSFLKDQDTRDIASYRLLVAIEAALNICYHVCSKQLTKVPENYAQCFGLLGEAGIISAELSSTLQRMARFRKLLVHVYFHVDDEQLYEIINNSLDDLRQFCSAIISGT